MLLYTLRIYYKIPLTVCWHVINSTFPFWMNGGIIYLTEILYLKHQIWIKSDGFIAKVEDILVIKYNLSVKIAILKQTDAKSLKFTPK